VTDREVLPGCARVRTKCAEKTSVGLWGQSRNPRELPGVIGPSHGVVGVLQMWGLRQCLADLVMVDGHFSPSEGINSYKQEKRYNCYHFLVYYWFHC
jgi:hypothetical protein